MSRDREDALRHEMVETCRRMNSLGINQGTSGNLSARCGDVFLITPSAMPYEQMKPRDLMLMNPDGSYHGAHRPSSEWRFHRDILRTRTDIDAVLHCHSVYATSLAVHHKSIPSFHYMTGVWRIAAPACWASTDRFRSAHRWPQPWPWPSRWRRSHASMSRRCRSAWASRRCSTTRKWPG